MLPFFTIPTLHLGPYPLFPHGALIAAALVLIGFAIDRRALKSTTTYLIAGGLAFALSRWEIPIHPFGVLVATGCLLGAHLVERRAHKVGLDMDATRALITWVLVCGFIGAHLFDVLTYTPEELKARPWLIFEVWNGISSFGGFMGALCGFFYFLHKRKLPYPPYADALALGLAPGWVFGRAGCTIAHDHIGRLTHFFLAVRYPEDHEPHGTRHNLGFYEFLYAIVITAFLYWLARKPRPAGMLVGIMAVAYAPVRFCLDFLRATDISHADARYFGLTPGQYTSIVTLLFGLFVIRRAKLQNVVLPHVTSEAVPTPTGA